VVQFLDFTTHDIGMDIAIEQVRVSETSEVVSRTIREMQYRRDVGVIVMAIRKGDGHMLFNPPADTAVEGGDYLIVNAGSNRWNYQVKELALGVQRIVPEAQVSINPNAQPDKRSYRVDFSLFEGLAPQHQPVRELEESIREIKTGLESVGFADPDFRNSRLIRLKTLSLLKSGGFLTDDLYWR